MNLGRTIQTNLVAIHVFVKGFTRENYACFLINKTPRGVSVGCIGLRIASQGQDE